MTEFLDIRQNRQGGVKVARAYDNSMPQVDYIFQKRKGTKYLDEIGIRSEARGYGLLGIDRTVEQPLKKRYVKFSISCSVRGNRWPHWKIKSMILMAPSSQEANPHIGWDLRIIQAAA
jgi:hypothetical protein